MKKTIVIAGGTGFLGQVLEAYFTTKGYAIYILTRHPNKKHHVYWNGNDMGDWVAYLENTEALINLAGKSVNCRYTETNKRRIYDSRINSTTVLGKAIHHCKTPPSVWLNASTATIYEDSYYKEMTEVNGNIGDDFSMNIAKSWEQAFHSIRTPKTRKITLRTAIVLGKHGGAFIPLKRLAQLGLGGKQGHGKQKVSWIHEKDFARAIDFLIEGNHLGVFNIVAPKPTDNTTLMTTLRKALRVPIGISQPKWLLALGARCIGTETELVLKSRNVIPERLLNIGFQFEYHTLQDAIHALTSSTQA